MLVLLRNASELCRADVVRLLRETDEKSASGQLDSGFRIGERITDVTFWRNELNTELEKLVSETKQLSDIKRNIAKAEQVGRHNTHVLCSLKCVSFLVYRTLKFHCTLPRSACITVRVERASKSLTIPWRRHC